MPLSCAVLPSLRILDIPCVRHIGLNSHKGHNGARAPVMSQKGMRLNSHKGHQGARLLRGEGRGVKKKKLKAKHVKPKQNVHGKISPTTHTPLTFPGK